MKKKFILFIFQQPIKVSNGNNNPYSSKSCSTCVIKLFVEFWYSPLYDWRTFSRFTSFSVSFSTHCCDVYRCDKSSQQVAATNQSRSQSPRVFSTKTRDVTCENLWRCDLSHELKLVWVRATNRRNKRKRLVAAAVQTRRLVAATERLFAAISGIVCLGLEVSTKYFFYILAVRKLEREQKSMMRDFQSGKT